MKQKEINFINMTDAVCAVFDGDADAWSGKKPISGAVTAVKAYRSEITGLAYDQAESKTVDETRELKEAFLNMTGIALNIVMKIRPYAIATKQTKLATQVDFSESDLTRGKRMDSITRCKLIYNRGTEHQAKMNGYELTDNELGALEAAINSVALLSGNRDAQVGAGKTATEGIPVCIDKIRLQLEMLDDLVPALISNNTFVQDYLNNRQIIDR